MFGWMQGPQLPMGQSHMAVPDPDTQEVIPKEIASLVDWIKDTVRCVYPEKGNCLSPPIKSKWNTPEKAVDMLCMQALWDRTIV